MIKLTEYKNQAVGVFGLGLAGMAAAKSLLAGKAVVYAWDDNANAREKLRLEISAAERENLRYMPVEEWPWNKLAVLVMSPGISLKHACVQMAKEAGVPVRGEVDMLYKHCPNARYIGITGTNGKSTTTALIGHIFAHAGKQVQMGANFGTPALALDPMEKDGWYVLEMSSYQLDLVQKTQFDIAVLLNVTPDHLERHGSMENYVAAKAHIFEQQKTDGMALIGLDDGYCRDICIDLMRERRNNTVPFSVSQKADKGIYVEADGVMWDKWSKDIFRYDISHILALRGTHNWQNIAAAYAAARCADIAPLTIIEAIKTFAGLPHRLEKIAEVRGVTFLNDSKATNADAAARALTLFNPIYWIVGGRPKTDGLSGLERFYPRIAHAFLIGEAEDAFAKVLEGKLPYTRCGDLQKATEVAARMALREQREGAVVLLSPACASFDQWKNFEARGDAFRRMVEQLEKESV